MTVYITRNNSKTDVYHDNEDCYRLQRAVKVRELEEDHIIIQDKRLCRRCAGNIDRTYTRSKELNETLQKLQEVQGEYKILDNE